MKYIVRWIIYFSLIWITSLIAYKFDRLLDWSIFLTLTIIAYTVHLEERVERFEKEKKM